MQPSCQNKSIRSYMNRVFVRDSVGCCDQCLTHDIATYIPSTTQVFWLEYGIQVWLVIFIHIHFTKDASSTTGKPESLGSIEVLVDFL